MQPAPTIGGAFQDALSKATKATSEQQAQQISNKTVEHQPLQTANTGPAPSKPLASNPQQQTTQGSAETLPPKAATQELVKSANQPSQNLAGHQQPLVDASQKAPAVSQNAQVVSNHQNEAKLAQPTVHPGQTLKEAAALQPNNQPPKGQQHASAPSQMQGATTQGSPAQPQVAVQAKPSLHPSIAPPQQKPTTPVLQPQTKQQLKKIPTHQQPTHRPTVPTTLKMNRIGGQLATATRPENIHHVFQPTGPLRRPTPPSTFKNQPIMQHFPTKGKYKDEEK